MSQLVVLDGSLLSAAREAFATALADKQLHKNSVVICCHGIEYQNLKPGQEETLVSSDWLANVVDSDNQLNLPVGHVQVKKIIKVAKRRFPWAVHIVLWICNPHGIALDAKFNVNITYWRKNVTGFNFGKFDISWAGVRHLPADSSSQKK